MIRHLLSILFSVTLFFPVTFGQVKLVEKTSADINPHGKEQVNFGYLFDLRDKFVWDGEHYYGFSLQAWGTYNPIIQKFDKDFNFIGHKKINFERFFEDLVLTDDGRLCAMVSQREEKTYKYWSQEIDKNDFSLKELREITSVPLPKRSYRDGFYEYYSPDSSQILLVHKYSKYKKKAKALGTIVMHMDKNRNVLWQKTCFEHTLSDFSINNKGEVFFLSQNQETGKVKLHLETKEKSKDYVVSYEKENLLEDGVFSLNLSMSPQGFPYVVGLHGTKPDNPANSVDGYFIWAFDGERKEVDWRRMVPCRESILKEFFYDRETYTITGTVVEILTSFLGLAQDADLSSDVETFPMKKLVFAEDGSFYLTTEFSKRWYHRYMVDGQVKVNSYYIHNEVLVSHFSSEGKLYFEDVVRKFQQNSSGNGLGYSTYLNNGKFYVIFNDNGGSYSSQGAYVKGSPLVYPPARGRGNKALCYQSFSAQGKTKRGVVYLHDKENLAFRPIGVFKRDNERIMFLGCASAKNYQFLTLAME